MTIQIKCDMCGTVQPLASTPDSVITDALPPAAWERVIRFDFCPNCVGDIRHFFAKPAGGPGENQT